MLWHPPSRPAKLHGPPSRTAATLVPVVARHSAELHRASPRPGQRGVFAPRPTRPRRFATHPPVITSAKAARPLRAAASLHLSRLGPTLASAAVAPHKVGQCCRLSSSATGMGQVGQHWHVPRSPAMLSSLRRELHGPPGSSPPVSMPSWPRSLLLPGGFGVYAS